MGFYLHCAKCIGEATNKRVSADRYARLEISIEDEGLLIFCIRHNAPVALITPDSLTQMMREPPTCDLCEQGIPHDHEREH